ncbi:putative mitochondrial protein AtMg00860 [Castanea sativa]|uniref:putative mitochondrial protein AtMg00860 n=1 Tax=Castanea sativa TaxID=21020 RepID=UPI003F654013
MQEGPGSPNCMIAQEEIPKELVQETQIQPEEELIEINLGAELGSQKPVFISSQLTSKYKLCMNPMKCAFGVPVRKFLGFLVHHRGISVDPAKVMAIATMKRPTMVRELKVFLGRVSYIRRFMPGLASVTSGLSKLLKKGTEFTWGAEQQEAF